MAKGCASFLSGPTHQLTRSLEKILEDAHLSGELRLSGKKLREFPKSGGKYDLSDTVIAGRLRTVMTSSRILPLF